MKLGFRVDIWQRCGVSAMNQHASCVDGGFCGDSDGRSDKQVDVGLKFDT